MPERKPPRMRAACGQCHSAKVKCSGERSGCTRCRKLDLKCEYGVSMVGRASKKKTTKNGSGDGGDEDDEQDISMLDGGLPLSGASPPDGFSIGNNGGGAGDLDEFNFNIAPQDLLSITGLDDFSFYAFPSDVPGFAAMPELSTTTTAEDSSASNQDDDSGEQQQQQHQPHVHYHYQLPTPMSDPNAGTTPTPQFQQWQQQQQQQNTNFNQNNHHHNSHQVQQKSSSSKPYKATLPPEPWSLSAGSDAATESAEPIFRLARLSNHLERQLARGAADGLDRVLGTIKQALRELMHILGGGEGAGANNSKNNNDNGNSANGNIIISSNSAMSSHGCRALIFACLALIVKIYRGSLARYRAERARAAEAAARNKARSGEEDEEDEDMMSSSSAPSSPVAGAGGGGVGVPGGMRLGTFEVDPEDQMRIQNQIIAAELGRCVHVIKSMARESARLCDRGGNCGGVKNYEVLANDALEMKKDLEKESAHDKRMVHPLI